MPTRTTPNGCLTEREAARLIGISLQTLRKYRGKFDILSYRAGRGARKRIFYRTGSVLRHAEEVREFVGTWPKRATDNSAEMKRSRAVKLKARVEREVQKRIAGREIQPLPKPEDLPLVAARRGNSTAEAQRNRLLYLLAEHGGVKHAELGRHIAFPRQRIEQIIQAEALAIDRARRAATEEREQ